MKQEEWENLLGKSQVFIIINISILVGLDFESSILIFKFCYWGVGMIWFCSKDISLSWWPMWLSWDVVRVGEALADKILRCCFFIQDEFCIRPWWNELYRGSRYKPRCVLASLGIFMSDQVWRSSVSTRSLRR